MNATIDPSFAVGPAPAQAAAAGWQPVQAPGYYRLRLGDFRLTVLLDGSAARDPSPIMSQPAAVAAAYVAAHGAWPAALSINAYLVDTGNHRILIDCGAGELFGAGAGALIANLGAAGYRPEDIDVILLTHIHADHSGGLSIGGRRLFANATVHVDRRDPAYWLAPDMAAAIPGRRASFEHAHRTVDPYVEAGRLVPFDGATELFAGIRSVPEYGHTPGQCGYRIESRGECLLIWGDIVHVAEIQFADPSVTIAYDVDPDRAARSRRQVLADAARRGYLVGGAHLSFPGLGHVRKDGDRFVWVPAPYRTAP